MSDTQQRIAALERDIADSTAALDRLIGDEAKKVVSKMIDFMQQDLAQLKETAK